MNNNEASNPDPELPATGAVFTFGKSKFADNNPSKFWIKKDLILAISCGDEHTAVATASGRLFTFGNNDWGQLGLGHRNSVLKPSCVKSLKPDKVVSVACGKAHTLVYMASGLLFAFGSNADGQLGVGRTPEWTDKPVELTARSIQRDKIIALAAGSSHSMALGEKSLYVWGSNTESQLGLGQDSEETIFVPVTLNFSQGVIKNIACGYYHSAFVTERGMLFTFGDSEGGKLGHGEASRVNGTWECVESPTQVQLNDKVTEVSCGGSHTVVLTEKGHIFTFGISSNGQLGLGTKVLESFRPELIQSLVEKDCKITHISCGENHTSLVTEKGHLLTFGDGRHGKLCLDTETITNHYTPRVSSRFTGFNVKKAICGGCHTMVFASPIPDYINEQNDEIHEDELLNGNGEDINWNARQKHREELEKRLPPIKPQRQIRVLSDPEEILNIGTEYIKVNGNEGEEESHANGNAQLEDEGQKDEDQRSAEETGVAKEGDSPDETSDNEEKNGSEVPKKDGKIKSFFKGFGSSKKESSAQEIVQEKEEVPPSQESKKTKKIVTFFSRKGGPDGEYHEKTEEFLHDDPESEEGSGDESEEEEEEEEVDESQEAHDDPKVKQVQKELKKNEKPSKPEIDSKSTKNKVKLKSRTCVLI